MASPTPKKTSSDPFSRYPTRPPAGAPEVVDAGWLLKALFIVIGGAALCGYLAICLLVYQGGWQLVLHPVAQIAKTPAIPFEPIRFDASATGLPRLSGWWLPAASATPTTRTVLFLHDGAGNLSSNVAQLTLLHQLNLNVFAFDYRGFGQSDPPHPTESRMTEDTLAAYNYLTDARHIAPATIVPYGVGLGAPLAAGLAQSHPGTFSDIVIDNPDPDAAPRQSRDTRSRLIPTRLLLQEHFNLTTPLNAIATPRLFLIGGPGNTAPQRDADITTYARSVRDPKLTVTLPSGAADSAYLQAISRFLDEYPLANKEPK